jgi:uncharacterized SAM-binding protein YcdF (DUF218 family)
MTAQGFLGALALPPLALALLALAGGLAAWRGWRAGGLLAAAAALGMLVLATPFASDLLAATLEREAAAARAAVAPAAIVILSAEAARSAAGVDIGPLTLERLRAGAALHRRTGLPVLVSGGSLGPGEPALATLMARSLTDDFGVTARWQEVRSRDTRENAAFSATMLRAEGVTAAYVVTHGWHLPRAIEAFGRHGFAATPAPVRPARVAPGIEVPQLVPRADRLGLSWYVLREWTGRLAYALRG